MHTLRDQKTPAFCRGYIRAIEQAEALFEHTYSRQPISSACIKPANEAAYRWSTQPMLTKAEKEEAHGEFWAWQDINSFCVEFLVGWDKSVFDCWLTLRKLMAMRHLEYVSWPKTPPPIEAKEET